MEVPFSSLYFAGHLVHSYSYAHMRTVPAFSHTTIFLSVKDTVQCALYTLCNIIYLILIAVTW